MSIGAQIRSLRTERGMTLAELARRTGISASNLSLIERDLTDPRWSTVERIFDALGLSPMSGQEPGSGPWARLRRKAERGEDVRDEAWALAANTARRARTSAGS
jgi:transcriptional regulator with XRE-family HTH domain